MNQNIAYFPQANIEHRQAGNAGPNGIQFHDFPGGFHTSNSNSFHTNSTTFTSQNQQHNLSQNNASIPNQRIATTVPVSVSGSGQQPATVHVQLVPQGSSPVTSQQHIIIATQAHNQNAGGTTSNVSNATGNEPEDRRMAAFMEYFVEQQPVCSTVQPNAAIQYQTPTLNTKYAIKSKLNASVDKSEREMLKRAKQAEAARQRYHRLTPDEKKDLNLKRTLAQKRKRQREKELSELEQILRMTNDIVDDPEVTEQLREKRMRARWAEAARTRYQRMSSEERRQHNTKRRLRQTKGEKGEPDDEESRQRVREQNIKKAEAARLRYHRMSAEEKKLYNQRRTEAFRRRRMEEEALLAMPIGRINGEALDRAQQIVVRNAKRAEAARLRYQRMTPEQRKLYNQKRYTPKRKREQQDSNLSDGSTERPTKVKQQHEYDALSSLERDVIRRTQQAQQSLLRQRQQQQPGVATVGTPPGTAVPGVSIVGTSPYNNVTTLGNSLGGLGVGQTLGNALAAQQNQLHQNPQSLAGLQLGGSNVANTLRHQIQQQHPIQLQYTSGGMVQHQLQQAHELNRHMNSTTSGEQIIAYGVPPHSSSYHADEEEKDDESDIQSYHRQLPPSGASDMHESVHSDYHDSIDQMQPESSTSAEDLSAQQQQQPPPAPPVDEKELRRQRLAEMARLRYQNLSKEEKKAVNSRRMLLRKRKRQREREMEELERILRSTNDIEEDVVFIGELREKRQRESRARAARSRYHSMTPEERRAYNQKRRLRQLGISGNGENGEMLNGSDSEVIKQQVAQQNKRKAELARQRYHRMSIEERKIYNKRRTESLRRRRLEEEALLATPAGQIDSEALQRAQQIMIRNALRAEKARERYKRKAPEERERKRARQAIQKAIKQEQSDPNSVDSRSAATSGDILNAIEREVARRTMEAQRVLEQKRLGFAKDAHLSPHMKQEAVIIQYSDNKPIIAHCPVPHPQQIMHTSQGGQLGPHSVHGTTHISHQHAPHHVHEAAPPPPQHVQEVMVLPSGAIVQQSHHGALPPHHAGAPPPHQPTIVSAAPFHGQTIVHAAAPATGAAPPPGNIIMQDASGKPITKYVSYMQLPSNATTQSGFILADGQFVAIQEPVQGYAIEQPVGFDGNFQHINPTTAVLRTSGGQNAQPIIIGQRVELVDHHTPISYHQQQPSQLQSPNTIHVVNYSGIQHQQPQPIQQPHQPQQHHIITQHLPQQQHYSIQQQHISQPMALMSPQQQQVNVIPVSATASTSSAATSGAENQYQVDEKVMSQRAKRAERARRRYHEMSSEARHEFNAKRAHALKMSRLKDEELCRLGDELEMTQQEISEELRSSIEQARIRRAKRAETARQKYQKMTPEQRKIHNAMRDAQRRQRKRELEESGMAGSGTIEDKAPG